MSTGYLGPAGTFSHQALLSLQLSDALVPLASTPAALAAVRAGEVDQALVPFENSVEGSVPPTLDGLADLAAAPLVVRAEVLLPVHFALLAPPGTALAEVRSVATHPHAAAQCRAWLAATLPDAEVVLVSSTSAGAAGVAAGSYDAAVSSVAAAAVHGLDVLADDVADADGGVTRFVLVGPPGPLPAPSGHDRTTLVLFERSDAPGTLAELLHEFAVRGINLSRLESRPTGAGLGSYCFHLDADGHVADARLGDALSALHRAAGVRFLGSYAKADRTRSVPLRPGNDDADYAGATAWLARVRRGDAD